MTGRTPARTVDDAFGHSEIHDVACPRCGHVSGLSHRPYVHRGYPHHNDRRTAAWTFECDGCGEWLHVLFDLRLRRENPDRTGWSTYAYLIGAPIFTDRDWEPIR